MKKILLALAVSLTLVSCDETVYESSEVIKEKAIVVTLIHSPSEHRTEITPTMMNHGSPGLAVDINGNTGIGIGKSMQITSTTIPAKYGVAFQCDHGTFTIEGSDSKDEVLYHKLYQSVGDTVTILYKEVYRSIFEEVNGNRILKSRELYKLDFIDAQK